MYVRTNKGQIFDCIESEQMGKQIYYPKNSKTNGYIDYSEVYKKSNNIIDICEVGDYVNGHLVFDKNPEAVYIEDNQNKLAHIPLTKEDIKSIVTREQFEYKAINQQIKELKWFE